jgi:hypothetical protein
VRLQSKDVLVPIFPIIIGSAFKNPWGSQMQESASKDLKAETQSKICSSVASGPDFEEYCAEELRRSGWANVRTTKGSHDQGIDIIAENDDKIKVVLQCKFFGVLSRIWRI